MTPAEFRASMRSALSVWADLGILHSLNHLQPLIPSPEFLRVAHRGTSYGAVFRTGLEHRDYNLLLTDLAFLQFGFDGAVSPSRTRYAYYPNPYSGLTFERFVSESGMVGDEEDAWEAFARYLDEQESDQPVPPVRYEVAFQDYRHLSHPASHLHFGTDGSNRWPVGIAITPFAFSCLIGKMFYAEQWERVGAATEDEINLMDARLCKAKEQCSEIECEYLSETEKRQFVLW